MYDHVAGSVWINLGLKTDNFTEGIEDVNDGLKNIDAQPAQKQLMNIRGSILEMGKDWKKTALAVAEVTAPIIAAAYALNKVTADAAENADRIINPESKAIASEYAAQLKEVNEQLEAIYIEIGVKLIPIMQQAMPMITDTVIPGLEALANVVGVVVGEIIWLTESFQALWSAMTLDFEGAGTHLQNSTDAFISGTQSGVDLVYGTSHAGLTSSTSAKSNSLSSTDRRKSEYERIHGAGSYDAKKSGVVLQQNVNITATQQSPAQVNQIVSIASKSYALWAKTLGV